MPPHLALLLVQGLERGPSLLPAQVASPVALYGHSSTPESRRHVAVMPHTCKRLKKRLRPAPTRGAGGAPPAALSWAARGCGG